MVWNGEPIQIFGESRLEIGDNVYDKNTDFQNVFSDTSGTSLEKVKNVNGLLYEHFMKLLDYVNY